MARSNTKLLFIAAVALILAHAAPRAEEIAPADRTKLVQHLTTTRDQVIAESSKLSDAQWNFKAGPDRWSVGEVVEHLALAESFLYGAHQKGIAGPAATAEQRAATKGKDEVILNAIPDRTKKVQAPEPLQPKTSLGNRDQAIGAFRDRRAVTLAYATKTTDDLRSRVMDSPLGPVDAYQWLLFISAHTERHLAQLREVKANAQFPKM
jgi:hypothetical protein